MIVGRARLSERVTFAGRSVPVKSSRVSKDSVCSLLTHGNSWRAELRARPLPGLPTARIFRPE